MGTQYVTTKGVAFSDVTRPQTAGPFFFFLLAILRLRRRRFCKYNEFRMSTDMFSKKGGNVRIGKFEFTDAGKFEEVSERLWMEFVREGIRRTRHISSS